MKYGYTLVHHIGEDGEAAEGRILHMSKSRYDDIGPNGSGLVREATDEEVKAGYQPAFEKDTTTAPEVPGEGEKAAPVPENKKAREPANKAQG